ncbi:MAG: DUF423 domain-containing protein [Pseudomonadota bacterium]
MIVLFGAIAGFFAVALGAFGAHALKDGFGEEQLGWWETATLYLLVHAALATALAAADSARFGVAATLLLLGAVIFSGTLYTMALGGPRWLGAVTPIGGIGLLAGWAFVAAAAIRA